MDKQGYIDAQAKAGFKVGDYVRVTRSAESHENGWNNSWVWEMNKSIGETFRIHSIEKHRHGIRFEGKSFSYPFFILSPIVKKKTSTNRLASVYRRAATHRLRYCTPTHFPKSYDHRYDNTYSCHAVRYECLSQKRSVQGALDLYAEYFCPEGTDVLGPWFNEWGEPQCHRNLALLLMAEIAADL